MSIRKKLMILFLIITLVPLIGTIAMYEISIGFFSKKVSSDMRLEDPARMRRTGPPLQSRQRFQSLGKRVWPQPPSHASNGGT